MAGINTIRPRGDIKANWETLNPILKKQEFGVEWETEVGVGEAKLKIGSGTEHWNDLDYALVNDITMKTVRTFATVTAENPDLIEGSALNILWATTKKKFEYITKKITEINTSIDGIKTMIGTFKNITIESGGTAEAVSTITDAIKKLDTGKLSTADIYNGLDSTNIALALSAAQGKSLDQKITQLNTDFASTIFKKDGLAALQSNSRMGSTRLQIMDDKDYVEIFRSTDSWTTYRSMGILATKDDLGKAKYVSDLMGAQGVPTLVQWTSDTLNTPYKAGKTTSSHGFAIVYGGYSDNQVIFAMALGTTDFFIHRCSNGTPSGWETK